MNIRTVIHRTLLLRPPFTRQASKKASASQSHKQPSSLPPEKLRALISLYHESRNFISERNLSAKIDHVFATGFYASASGGLRFASRGDLSGALNKRRSSPRIGVPDVIYERDWSNNADTREREVFGALYGVDKADPGLDALLDEEERVKQMIREDREGEGAS